MKLLNHKSFPVLIISVILTIFGFIPDIAAQTGRELTTSNSRAKRAFENAVQQYNMRNIAAAEKEFMEAVRLDPNFIEAYIVMGEMFQTNNDHRKAIEAFRRAADINPGFFPM
jgi:Tfp pilus assembly protein PilF